MTTIPKLQNTTLCAIVRDEIINCAGGIANFIKETVPFVEKAVIVDTGSVDGTCPLGKYTAGSETHTQRFFKRVYESGKKLRLYENYVIEFITPRKNFLDSLIEIIHYSPTMDSEDLKSICWYEGVIEFKLQTPPSQVNHFKEWKKPHSDREKLVGVLV